MFHALISHKARLDVIIDGVGKQPREDLITSALFGTVNFLSVSARELALKALVGFKSGGSTKIILWPYFSGDGENSEPDVVLRTVTGGAVEYWVVEVKWGAGLGDDQVGREVRTVQRGKCRREELPGEDPPAGGRKVIGYTLVGAEAKHRPAMDQARQQLSPGLSVHEFAWPAITDRLERLAKKNANDAGLVAWAQTAKLFLNGTPQGRLLGPWPAVVAPMRASFHFDTNQRLVFGCADKQVAAAHFNFEEG